MDVSTPAQPLYSAAYQEKILWLDRYSQLSLKKEQRRPAALQV